MREPHIFAEMRLFIFCIALLFSSNIGLAQFNSKLGSLNVQNYLPKTYGANPQIFDITQDSRGALYFANQRGVIEYDGSVWRTIKVGNGREVNALACDQDGRVWVGAIGEIGYLSADKEGEMEFVSITHLLPNEHKEFGKVSKVHVTQNGVIYFQGGTFIFKYENKEFKVLPPPSKDDQNFHVSFLVDEVLYVRVTNLGLHRVTYDFKLEMLIDGVVFSNKSIVDMTRFRGQLILLADKTGVHQMNTALESRAIGVLEGIDLYSGLNINDELYAVGTFSQGVLVLDEDFKVQYHVDISSGMSDGKINCLFVDRENNLWAGTNKGISKIEVLSPVSIFSQNNGIKSGLEAVITYKEKVFTASQDGVYFMDFSDTVSRSAQKLEKINVDCYGLLTFPTQIDTFLLIAAVDGIYTYSSNTSEVKLITKCDPYQLRISKKNPNRVIISNVSGMASVLWTGKEFLNEGFIAGFEEEIFNFVIDENNTVWMGSLSNGLFTMKEDVFDDKQVEIQNFERKNGLPEGPVFIEIINGNPYFATEKGIYHKKDDKFELFNGFGVDFTKKALGCHRLSLDPQGKVWMVLFDQFNNYEIGFAEQNEQGKYEWKSREFSRYSDEIVHALHHTDDHITWLGGLKGLMRYDHQKSVDLDLPFNTLMRYVSYGNEVIFKGAFLNEDGVPSITQTSDFVRSLRFSGKNLTFRFSACSFVDEGRTEYSFMLVGQDDNWSEWSTNAQANYTNIKEGDYVFKVKARNVYGKESEITEFKISILPPWYRTSWAYGGYGVLFILLILGAIKFSTRRVKRQKEYLEGVVKERTTEVVQQKEEIEKQKVIVEEKNKDIMDSIKYAKRIQDAILPNNDILKRVFRDAFVLFRPKDIVSGDFYWIKEKKGKALFAAVDCTGHGVPGAFVSIIGNNGLNRSINEYELTEPAKILDRLAIIVEEAFVAEGSDVKDGMDIALCSLDRENMKLEFAGANNPLYIIRNEELIEIKGDKQPIGQFDKRRPYTNHVIDLQPNDIIYVFTDGYADQFGGPNGKKFKYSTLKALLLELADNNMKDVSKQLLKTFKEWKEGHEQIDDVCVIGVRI